MTVAASTAAPTILFGAFDRHNFGDLLFPHIVAALLTAKAPVFAGLAERDLRPCGGHHVEALAALASQWRDHPVDIIHAGGELLGCDAWQAAVMLLPPREAQDVIIRFHAHPQLALEWAQRRIGMTPLSPYAVDCSFFPHARAVIYNAVGGVDLDEREQEFQAEVLARLRTADAVGVRDARTQSHLHRAGIHARLMPDPAVMVAELFGDSIRLRGSEGEAAEVVRAFPQGYLAVQFSTEFEDDRTLSAIARQLDALVHATGLGIVFFRAGAAPWHDDLDSYQRTASRMQSRSVRVFFSLDMWDICALIAGSRGYLGSSLHGRIVAMAFALPRLNLVYSGQGAKQAAFASTWEDAQVPHVVHLDGIVQGMQRALAVDARLLHDKARTLAKRYRDDFAALCAGHISVGSG